MLNQAERLALSQSNQFIYPLVERGLSLYLRERRGPHFPSFFLGKDVNFKCDSRETENTLIKGVSTVDSDYFGNGLSPEEARDLVLFSITSRTYSSRSKLTQAGLSVLFNDIGINDQNQVVVGTEIVSLTGKPITNIPERFPLFRLFINDCSYRVEGEGLERIAPDIFPPGYKLNQIKNRPVTVSLPIESYLNIGASSVDIGRILKTKTRKELDTVLQIEPITGPIYDTNFVLGETGPVNIPPDHLLVILTGIDDERNLHLPSLMVDSGFSGRIRVEINTLGVMRPDCVEFNLFKT